MEEELISDLLQQSVPLLPDVLKLQVTLL